MGGGNAVNEVLISGERAWTDKLVHRNDNLVKLSEAMKKETVTGMKLPTMIIKKVENKQAGAKPGHTWFLVGIWVKH